jgi:hypothetical protein
MSTHLQAFQETMGAAFRLSNANDTSLRAIANALVSIEDPPELPTREFEELWGTEERLLAKLAASRPMSLLELAIKAERAITGLLKTVESGDRLAEIELGASTLANLQAVIREYRADTVEPATLDEWQDVICPFKIVKAWERAKPRRQQDRHEC